MKLFLALTFAIVAVSARGINRADEQAECVSTALSAFDAYVSASHHYCANHFTRTRISFFLTIKHRPAFYRTRNVCMMNRDRVVSTQFLINLVLHEDRLTKWFAGFNLEEEYKRCDARTDGLAKERFFLFKSYFMKSDCSFMEERLQAIMDCVREETVESCAPEEEEGSAEGSAEEEEEEEEEEGEILPPVPEEEVEEEEEEEEGSGVVVVGSGEEEEVEIEEEEEAINEDPECAREENFVDNYPTKVVEYEELNLDAKLDTIYGIANKSMERLNPAGFLEVKDIVCLYVKECRRFDRFKQQLGDLRLRSPWINHIYKQVNQFCDEEGQDCDEICKEEEEVVPEEPTCSPDPSVKDELPSNPPPYPIITEEVLEKKPNAIWGIGASRARKLSLNEKEKITTVKQVICKYQEFCGDLEKFMDFMISSGGAHEDQVKNVYQQMYEYCHENDCAELCPKKPEGGAVEEPKLDCALAKNLFSMAEDAAVDCKPDHLKSNNRYWNVRFPVRAPAFAKEYLHLCMAVRMGLADAKDKQTIRFKKEALLSNLGGEAMFHHLTGGALNGEGMYPICEEVEGGIKGMINAVSCMYNRQCSPQEPRMCEMMQNGK